MAKDDIPTISTKLYALLKSLDAEKRQWALQAAYAMLGEAAPAVGAQTKKHQRDQTGASTSTYDDFADLYDAAKPKTAHFKALVGGYWLQVCQGASSFPSADVNALLKNHGHPVSNITRGFDILRTSKPAFAAQIEKSGRSKQSRKKMKLTTSGIRKVDAMISGADEE